MDRRAGRSSVRRKSASIWASFGVMVTLYAAGLANELAHAEETTQVTGAASEEEAWFYRFRRAADLAGDPEDPTGTGLLDFLNTNAEVSPPYDGGTLRVGLMNGQPEARTFLALPSLFKYGADADIVGGHVTFPLHADDDSLREPERADMVACLATGVIIREEGANWANQPTFNCDVHAPLELEEGSDLATWTLDLAVFTAAWQAGSPRHGLAILENPDPAEGDASWHVAFRSKNHPDGFAVTFDLQIRGAHPASAGTTAGGGGIADDPLQVVPPRAGESGPGQPVAAGAIQRTDATPLGRLGRSTELLLAVIVALAGGGVILRTLNQAARAATPGTFPPEGTVAKQ